jgi:hypothetical protein
MIVDVYAFLCPHTVSTMTDTSLSVTDIPGTVYLVDINHSSIAAHDGSRDIILIPAPTSSPRDPLVSSYLRDLCKERI